MQAALAARDFRLAAEMADLQSVLTVRMQPYTPAQPASQHTTYTPENMRRLHAHETQHIMHAAGLSSALTALQYPSLPQVTPPTERLATLVPLAACGTANRLTTSPVLH